MFYSIVGVFLKIVLFFCFRIKVVGTENIPKKGGMILAVNHRSNLDPVIAGYSCPRPLTFMAKSELFKNPLFGKLITALGAFPVHRGSGDIGAIRSAFSILKSGKAMLIFPEGHRVKEGEKSKAQPGVAMIAQRSKVPVIPVFIEGKYRWMSKIIIHYGKPVDLNEYYDRRISSEECQQMADKILDEMYSLKGRE